METSRFIYIIIYQNSKCILRSSVRGHNSLAGEGGISSKAYHNEAVKKIWTTLHGSKE